MKDNRVKITIDFVKAFALPPATCLDLSIAGVPVKLYNNQGGYGGRFEPDPKIVFIGIPGSEADADRVVVLYMLLHELAHYKQSIKSKNYSNLLTNYFLGKKIDGGTSGPLERAANKYTMNVMTRLGIAPNVIVERLNKGFLFAYSPEALRTYNRWARKYFRSVTP